MLLEATPGSVALRRKAARGRTATSRIEDMKRARGFTLLEVVVTLAIAAIAYALLAGVIFRGPSAYDLKTSARTLAASNGRGFSCASAGPTKPSDMARPTNGSASPPARRSRRRKD